MKDSKTVRFTSIQKKKITKKQENKILNLDGHILNRNIWIIPDLKRRELGIR